MTILRCRYELYTANRKISLKPFRTVLRGIFKSLPPTEFPVPNRPQKRASASIISSNFSACIRSGPKLRTQGSLLCVAKRYAVVRQIFRIPAACSILLRTIDENSKGVYAIREWTTPTAIVFAMGLSEPIAGCTILPVRALGSCRRINPSTSSLHPARTIAQPAAPLHFRAKCPCQQNAKPVLLPLAMAQNRSQKPASADDKVVSRRYKAPLRAPRKWRNRM